MVPLVEGRPQDTGARPSPLSPRPSLRVLVFTRPYRPGTLPHMPRIFYPALTMLACLVTPLAGAEEAANEGRVYSEEQAVRGEELYQQYCSLCHGARLQGSPAAPLTGEAFRGRWEDGRHTLDDLYYIVRSLMPNNAPGSLSKAQYADVVAYILKVNNYPAGEAELAPKPAAMKAVILQPH
jgi:mono/diheme cytochrome c family protein